jgi:hypothetical protein
MNRRVLATLCVVTVMMGMLALNMYPPLKGQTAAKQPTPGAAPPASLPSPHPSSAPDYVVYKQVFHHLLALKEHAKDVVRRGGNGRALGNYYKDRARLNDDQELTFEKIAADCERDVAKLDAKAQKIIDAAHARFPDGKVPAGAQLPPPPPELHRLQLERISTIMEARNRLRAALGEQGFQQLDDFIKVNVAPQVQPQPIAPGQGKAAKHDAAR